MEGLLGSTFVRGSEKVEAAEALKAEVIALYFSAHWCPPCRQFTPVLVEFYKEINEDDKKLEIIFVSSDKDSAQFNEYYGQMPWLSIPFGDERIQSIKQKFGVTGIPLLIVLKRDGTVAVGSGRADVTNEGPACFEKWVAASKK